MVEQATRTVTGTTFRLDEEQDALRETVRRFCEQTWPEHEVRRLMQQDTHDPGVWSRLGQELGLIGLTLPTALGGAGAGWVELVVVGEQFGRVLACSPMLGTTMAATALAMAADAATTERVMEAVVSGDRTLALVATDSQGSWLPSTPSIRAFRADGAWRLRGSANHVLDGASSDDLLVVATTDQGLALFLVDGNARSLGRQALAGLDQTRKQARLTLDGVRGLQLAAGPRVRASLQAATDIGATWLAAEQVGGSRRLLELSISHATQRFQFGRPIGSFQAVRHRCADMAVDVEHASSALLNAAMARVAAADDVALASSLAFVACSDTHVRSSAATLQIHGGLGFTWEHTTHLYLKRAWSDSALVGGRPFHRRRLAPLLHHPIDSRSSL